MQNAENHHDDRELIDLLRLALIPGVGPKTRKRLLERFGTPAAVLAAAPSDLREIEGIGPKLMHKIVGEDRRTGPARRRRSRRSVARTRPFAWGCERGRDASRARHLRAHPRASRG